jgi:hypothetical protein
MAIWRWAPPSYDYGWGSFEPDAPPEPPPDPSLGKIRDVRELNDFIGVWDDLYPAAINPIPYWADLQPLSNALKAGQCAALKDLPPDFLPKLDALIALRAKDRAAAVPK